MIDIDRLRKSIEVPEGIDVEIGETFLVKKGNVEVRRRLSYPSIEMRKEENSIVLHPKKFSKREKKMINTFQAHIMNMIQGVQEPFCYKVKICASHFPMTVAVQGQELVIKNFLGEKVPRRARILEDVDVKVEGDVIQICSPNKEFAGQTAANFEQATRITNRDRRIFQDGLWIIQKGERIL